MKKRLSFAVAVALYLAILAILMQFDIGSMLQPFPLAGIAAGIVILTLFRFKKGMSLPNVLSIARWNALFAGTLMSLFMLLSELSQAKTSIEALAKNLIPLIYAGIVYVLISLALSFIKDDADKAEEPDLFNADSAIPVFRQKGFSERECHIALKLLEGLPNKQIASQLYISETTVKKHIQNLFRKCGATDRHDFVRLYMQWAKEQRSL